MNFTSPHPFRWAAWSAVFATLLCVARSPAAPPDRPIDFNRDIRPILSNNCYQCHGPDENERKAELRLDTFAGATADLGGSAAVVPGKPETSLLIERVATKDIGQRMPPKKSGKNLSANEVELLTRWVKGGATYAQHWSHVKPARPPLPTLRGGQQPAHPIDAFIRTRLAAENLQLSKEADRYTLLRRVSLDLIGLPPTPQEVETFVNDARPNAFELLVDRLLASPRYGEHWARTWLDLARYADSAGYADDPPRTIWKYRDYVIRAFNQNKPFDQFTVEQIAGDLLPNPTEEQFVATAFHRNTLTNNEGGTSDEEFRNVAVVDRVNTTLTVWMGTSAACAQCHNHKYDPLSQKEYFELFAFFNNTADADRTDETPILEIGDTPDRKARRTAAEKKLAGITKASRFQPPLVAAGLRIQADGLQKAISDLKPLTTVPIVRELPEKERRKTRIQHRGNFLELGDEVRESVPAAFHPLPKDAPRNRLTLARWLVSPDNPLTARVVVNRYWEQIFGTGLVRTSEEFGIQGELPSHPELLDWLATELVRQKWDTKAFLKLLVTSAAYRQSSKVTPALLEKDPDNRLLARGPRVRLTAEMVRDQALAVSGLLSGKLYGPSVKPPQPEFGVTAAFGRSMDWQPSTGDDRYRRGIYTEWRRTNPYPSMSTFDAPNRDICTVRRARTNTPLQALVTLNDQVYIEAAQALARRIAARPGETLGRAKYAVALCLSRPASEPELARLVALYTQTKAELTREPKKATDLATNPLGPAPKGADVADLAAWAVVSNVLLNLDEMLMKR